MIEFVAVRCPQCASVVAEVLSGAKYPPFRVRCRKRVCGVRATVTAGGTVVQVDSPLKQLAAENVPSGRLAGGFVIEHLRPEPITLNN